MASKIVFIILVLLITSLSIPSFFIGKSYGFSEGKIYGESKKKQYDGCWASVKSGSDMGDWVCVNVENMKYERAVEVCKHEVGHEIFAEECEKDIDKCFSVLEGLEE